jgi:hypothetical protein
VDLGGIGPGHASEKARSEQRRHDENGEQDPETELNAQAPAL